LPLAASVIVKTFAWTILLRSDGVINRTLMALGLTNVPIRMIFTETALVIGAMNIFLPFTILPIYSVVAQLDPRLSEAAATLGASPIAIFTRVIVPLTLPGVISRCGAHLLAGGLGPMWCQRCWSARKIRRSRRPLPRPTCWRVIRCSAPPQ
jgi:ABC-type spermidine/putrescine transport system permease subunit I